MKFLKAFSFHFQFSLQRRNFAIAKFCCSRKVSARLCRVGLKTQSLESFFNLFYLSYCFLLIFPLEFYFTSLFAQIGNLFVDNFQSGLHLRVSGFFL